MILKIYSVFDSKAKAFATPFFTHNDDMAIRIFEAATNQEGTPVFQHAADYTLFELGEFNDQAGAITTLDTPRSMGLAIEYQKPPDIKPQLDWAHPETLRHLRQALLLIGSNGEIEAQQHDERPANSASTHPINTLHNAATRKVTPV